MVWTVRYSQFSRKKSAQILRPTKKKHLKYSHNSIIFLPNMFILSQQ